MGKPKGILCKKCNTPVIRSKGIINQLVTTNGRTWIRLGPPWLVSCYKCPNCGHSFTLNN